MIVRIENKTNDGSMTDWREAVARIAIIKIPGIFLLPGFSLVLGVAENPVL